MDLYYYILYKFENYTKKSVDCVKIKSDHMVLSWLPESRAMLYTYNVKVASPESRSDYAKNCQIQVTQL